MFQYNIIMDCTIDLMYFFFKTNLIRIQFDLYYINVICTKNIIIAINNTLQIQLDSIHIAFISLVVLSIRYSYCLKCKQHSLLFFMNIINKYLHNVIGIICLICRKTNKI